MREIARIHLYDNWLWGIRRHNGGMFIHIGRITITVKRGENGS